MRQIVKSAHRDPRLRSVIRFLLLVSMLSAAAGAQARPDFSGLWKQDNERSQSRRHSDMALRIEHRDPDLAVETMIASGTQGTRHALQKYTTDGKVSISTGADGDEFHTSIIWMGQSLVFSIEEHEEGRILLSRETWTLLEDGAVLERVREPLDAPAGGAGKQTLIYARQSPKN